MSIFILGYNIYFLLSVILFLIYKIHYSSKFIESGSYDVSKLVYNLILINR